MPNAISRSTATRPSTRTPISVSSNDPVLKVRKSGSEFVVSGTATNSGTKASRLTTEVGGKLLSVPLSRGMTPEQAARALGKAMPKGYRLTITFAADHIGGTAGFTITQGRAAKPKPAPSPASNATPPLWYLQWKYIGKAPPKTVHGTFRFGDAVVKVANGRVTKVTEGIVQGQNGKAVVVSGGHVVGLQG